MAVYPVNAKALHNLSSNCTSTWYHTTPLVVNEPHYVLLQVFLDYLMMLSVVRITGLIGMMVSGCRISTDAVGNYCGPS